MLHRIIAALASAGIREIAIVTGHMAEAVESVTGDGSRWDVRIHYRRQSAIDGTARALALTRAGLRDEPFFVGWGDIVVDPANYAGVIAGASGADGALAVNSVDDPSAGAAVYLDHDGLVTGLVEKPPPGASDTTWNNAGLMVLPRAIWPFVEALEPSERGEYELLAAVAAFVAAGGRMRAVPIEGPWFDAGTPESLAAARAAFGSDGGPRTP
jgi:dTDP-glucose pyrophosphorylase